MALISKLSFILLFSLTAVASAAGYGNVDAPKTKLPTPDDHYDDYKQKQLLQPLNIAVQGIVYCKSGTKLIPLKGALARITCLGMDKYGYESAPFSVLSHPTDSKGYFFTSFSLSQFKEAVKITECKAFLESSPLESCKFPTDVNRGHTGTIISAYRVVGVGNKKAKLYSVGPFVYANESKPSSVSKGY